MPFCDILVSTMKNVEIPNFPNQRIGKPENLHESQCKDVMAVVHEIQGTNLDGLINFIMCYQLDDLEIASLQKNGGKLFMSCIGGIMPHMITMSIEEASFGNLLENGTPGNAT